MSGNRVPSTEDVRNAAESSHDWWRYRDDPHAFSTWLAGVKAQALRDAADFLDGDKGGNSAGYKLRVRAARIERGEVV